MTDLTFPASIRSARNFRFSAVNFATKNFPFRLPNRDAKNIPARWGRGPSPRYVIFPPTSTTVALGVSTRLHFWNDRLPAMSSCTAYVPTPPEAPLIRTFWPGCTFPWSRSACSAVIAAIGTAAASSNDTFAGFGARRASRATAYSAQAPGATPSTSSPGRKSSTALPTASTRPARSVPTSLVFGFSSPDEGRAKSGPVTWYHSAGFTDDACTRTSTWSSPTTGMSTSRSSTTPGRPYRSWTIAFIDVPPTYGVSLRGRRYTYGVSLSRDGSTNPRSDEAHAPEQGACAARCDRTGGQGRDRSAQHAQARAGARGRGDVALQPRGQQERRPRRDGRRGCRRDSRAGKRRRLEDGDPDDRNLVLRDAPAPSVGGRPLDAPDARPRALA